MKIFRILGIVALVCMPSLPEKTYAEVPKPGPVPAPNTPTSLNKAPLVPDRTPGMITIKPLTVNFSGLTFGMSRKSQKINGWTIDPYQSSFATFSNQAQAIGTSYDLELGVMLTSQIEAFVIAGIDYQRPFSKIIVSNNNPIPFGQYDTFAYDFKARHNYGFSLGGRYYWNTIKPWFPFIGLMGTVIRQDAVRAFVFQGGPNAFVPTYPAMSLLTLQNKKTLWGGTLQVGADYQLSKMASLTFVVGLQYTPRGRMSYSTILLNSAINPAFSGLKTITCRDNRNLWSVPFMVSLKFTL